MFSFKVKVKNILKIYEIRYNLYYNGFHIFSTEEEKKWYEIRINNISEYGKRQITHNTITMNLLLGLLLSIAYYATTVLSIENVYMKIILQFFGLVFPIFYITYLHKNVLNLRIPRYLSRFIGFSAPFTSVAIVVIPLQLISIDYKVINIILLIISVIVLLVQLSWAGELRIKRKEYIRNQFFKTKKRDVIYVTDYLM